MRLTACACAAQRSLESYLAIRVPLQPRAARGVCPGARWEGGCTRPPPFLGLQVDAESIREHAYPCCAKGGECCLPGQPCCSLPLVNAWLERTLASFNWTRRGLNYGLLPGQGRDPRLYAPPIYMQQSRFTWPGPGVKQQWKSLPVER